MVQNRNLDHENRHHLSRIRSDFAAAAHFHVDDSLLVLTNHKRGRFLRQGFEDRRVFHPQGRELVDIEEAPIIDFLGRDTPVGEPIGLLIEQSIEIVEAARLASHAVEVRDARIDQRADAGAGGGQRGEPPLDNFFLARPRRDVA